MKRFFAILTTACLAISLQAQDWVQTLIDQNRDVIDTIKVAPRQSWEGTGTKAYHIYYRQPLQHQEPELGDFKLRAVLVVPEGENPASLVTQVYFSGYNIDDNIWNYPNYYFNYFRDDPSFWAEICMRYEGCLLFAEHRYFGKSCPTKPWNTLGYCTSEEAAADFHSLFQALKKVFTNKWAITGVSKGGNTVAIQHTFYPEDADCFIAYSAPYNRGTNDPRMQQYWMTESLTPELREEILHIQYEILHRPAVFETYCNYYKTDPYWYDYMRANMLSTVATLDWNWHCYSNRQTVQTALNKNRDIIAKANADDYTDEMLAYMLINRTPELSYNYRLNAPSRIDFRDLKHEIKLPVFGIKSKEWDSSMSGFLYQAAIEQGYFDLSYDFFYDTQAECDSVNTLWREQAGTYFGFGNETFDTLQFSFDLRDLIMERTSQTDANLMFLYGSDDCWAGAAMDDECINGYNVRKYILEAQQHGCSVSAETDSDLQQEIFNWIDAAMSDVTGISDFSQDRREGRHIYNLQGQRVATPSRGINIINGKLYYGRQE